MPRGNDGNEIFKYLTSVTKYTVASGTHGSTTTSGSTAVDATTILLTSATNFTASDPILVASSAGTELNYISGSPTTSSTLGLPAAFLHPAGAIVTEMVAANLGHLDEAGVTMTGSLTLNAVNASTSRTPIAYIPGQGALGGSFNLRGYNNLNLMTVFGIPEAESGAGTGAAPYRTAITTTNIGTDTTIVFRAVGVLMDARTATVDFVGVTPSVNANITIGGQSPAVLAVQFNCTGIISYIHS